LLRTACLRGCFRSLCCCGLCFCGPCSLPLGLSFCRGCCLCCSSLFGGAARSFSASSFCSSSFGCWNSGSFSSSIFGCCNSGSFSPGRFRGGNAGSFSGASSLGFPSGNSGLELIQAGIARSSFREIMDGGLCHVPESLRNVEADLLNLIFYNSRIGPGGDRLSRSGNRLFNRGGNSFFRSRSCSAGFRLNGEHALPFVGNIDLDLLRLFGRRLESELLNFFGFRFGSGNFLGGRRL